MPVRNLVVLALLGAAVACSGPPWIMSASADRVVLRWYTDDVVPGVAPAQVKADVHCAQTGRRATLVSTQMSGSAQFATFECH